jgi:hypothetical protein
MMVLQILFIMLLFSSAKVRAEEGLAQLHNNFTESGSAYIKEIIGYKLGSTSELERYSLEAAQLKGEAKRQIQHEMVSDYECTANNCELGHTFSVEAQLKRKEAFAESGFGRDENGFPINGKGYLDKAIKEAQESKNKFDFITGEYKDCKISEGTEIKTCQQYYDFKQNSCEEVIEIDPNYAYECAKNREIKNKVCEKSLIVKCIDKVHTPAVFTEFAQVNSYKSQYHNNPPLISGSTISIGNINGGNDVNPGSCTTYTTGFEVNIHNLKDLGHFTITKVNIDDDLRLIVNGTEVYRTPSFGSGDKGMRVYYPNHEIRQNLIQGSNNFITEMIICGWGHGGIQFSVGKAFCKAWDEKMEEKCTYM